MDEEKNSAPSIVNLTNSIHSKIDEGFKRIHDRLDDQRATQSNISEEVIKLHGEFRLSAQSMENTMDNHLKNHPDNTRVNIHLEEAKEDSQGKAKIVRDVAEWGIRAVIVALLAKLGIDIWT